MKSRSYEITVFEHRENLSLLRASRVIRAPFGFVHDLVPTVSNVRRVVHDLLPLAVINEMDMSLSAQIRDGMSSGAFSVSVRMDGPAPDVFTSYSVLFMEC